LDIVVVVRNSLGVVVVNATSTVVSYLATGNEASLNSTVTVTV
jgi:hypothetical protein